VTAIDLSGTVAERASALGVPGVAAGVWAGGELRCAYHGVTSVEHPLAVDARTLFQAGSIGKTYTATAIELLAQQGLLELDAPVRTYVPELRLRDERVAAQVTVLQLLNHTAGWEGDHEADTGDGDDALARYVAQMAELPQLTQPGAAASYNNVSFSLAGHLIARLTGRPYEQAMRELVLDPLGLHDTLFAPSEIMARRFATAHNERPDEGLVAARSWGLARSAAPAGGIASTLADLMAWARFHLADGVAADGTRVLAQERARAMRAPTVATPGASWGDAIGVAWMLREVDGVQTARHTGDTTGQHAALLLAPERDFAVAVLTNAGPGGRVLRDELVRWALEAYLGAVEREPEPIDASDERLAEYAGSYETEALVCRVSGHAGRLRLVVEAKPTAQESDEELPPDMTLMLGLLSPDGDGWVVAEGAERGVRGYFTRDGEGRVDGLHLGRFCARTG
jgi:CubicO group peptidase (beta-lactamase class C family)